MVLVPATSTEPPLSQHCCPRFANSSRAGSWSTICRLIALHSLVRLLAMASSRFSATWLDSARVARRAWTRFAERGYALKNLAHELDIPLQHHDAASDAAAAGLVVARAVSESGLSVAEWLTRALERKTRSAAIRREGDPEGHLYGENIVFTGKLSFVRREAADAAAKAGANVANSVSRNTTILVVGVQDLRRTNGRSKSSKHRKAEGLIEDGHQIKIIGEEDFLSLTELDQARRL